MTSYLFTPPAVQSLPIRGQQERYPINRIFCVGRNYHAHAVEMGRPVDKSVEQAFYFTKSPQTLVESGAPWTTHRAPTTTTSKWSWFWPLAKQVFA
jgi:fumarylpyruvate hydrolase